MSAVTSAHLYLKQGALRITFASIHILPTAIIHILPTAIIHILPTAIITTAAVPHHNCRCCHHAPTAQVRGLAKAKAPHGELLATCDRVRDDTLPLLGVRLEDRADGADMRSGDLEKSGVACMNE